MKVITQSTKTKVFMKKIISFISMIVIVLFFSITVVQAQPVKGELTTINGKHVLRVWGSFAKDGLSVPEPEPTYSPVLIF